jgi:predicted nucleic acid-binding protein
LKAAANTSVLLALGRLGYLKLLKEVFDKIVVGESVFEEVRDSEVLAQVSELIDKGFIEVAKTEKLNLLDLLLSSLGKGEAENHSSGFRVKSRHRAA